MSFNTVLKMGEEDTLCDCSCSQITATTVVASKSLKSNINVDGSSVLLSFLLWGGVSHYWK